MNSVADPGLQSLDYLAIVAYMAVTFQRYSRQQDRTKPVSLRQYGPAVVRRRPVDSWRWPVYLLARLHMLWYSQ